MSTTTVELSAETTRRLDALRRDGESDDDVIRRLTEHRWAWVGMCDETDPDEAREGLSEIRAELNERYAERIEQIGDR